MLNRIKKSLDFAFQGFYYSCNTQFNFRVELLYSVIIVGLFYTVDLTYVEWMIVVLSLIILLASELFNTAIELICDLVNLKYNLKIKRIKDVAAAGVLLNALLVIGVHFKLLFIHLL